MPHQEELTVVAKIKPGRVSELESLLGTIEQHPDNGWNVIPFGNLGNVHFASLFVLPETQLDGEALPAQLIMMTNVDAPLASHLVDLATVCGAGLDQVFGLCEGYPEPTRRSAKSRERFLKRTRVKAELFYANRQGRTVEQIRQEAALREALEDHLDGQPVTRESSARVRDSILAFVRSQPSLRWALRPAAGPGVVWRTKEAADLLAGLGAVALMSPALLMLAPFAVAALRRNETREVPDPSAAPPERVKQLRADEDFTVQNQIIAAGAFKGGWFRRLTSRAVFRIADYAIRHVYNRGSLSDLNTIHFARWVPIDNGKRLFFASNYDGTLESYMDDFIDKAAWGLNAIFSNGEGFPRTAFLFCLGIRDEIAYKRFLPTRQVRTNVWYRAYPQLTTKNIANSSAIRAGLSARMNEAETRDWLSRFGAGNRLPQPGVVAQLLGRIRWDRTCQDCR